MQAMPVLFVGHGAPTLALDFARGSALTHWAAQLPRPESILCISAHWERSPPTLGTFDHTSLLYDFSGFPDELYRLTYAAPGAPALADDVRSLLAPHYPDVADAPTRHLDHGVWVPLRWLYPHADVPVLQLSLPRGGSPAAALELGVHLAPLRERGVLIVASGVLVHNLSQLGPDGSATPAWATEFDTWCAHAVEQWAVEDLVLYRERAPHAARAHPTEEHYTPLLVAVGAASSNAPEMTFPVVGFEYSTVSRRCIQFG